MVRLLRFWSRCKVCLVLEKVRGREKSPVGPLVSDENFAFWARVKGEEARLTGRFFFSLCVGEQR